MIFVLPGRSRLVYHFGPRLARRGAPCSRPARRSSQAARAPYSLSPLPCRRHRRLPAKHRARLPPRRPPRALPRAHRGNFQNLPFFLGLCQAPLKIFSFFNASSLIKIPIKSNRIHLRLLENVPRPIISLKGLCLPLNNNCRH